MLRSLKIIQSSYGWPFVVEGLTWLWPTPFPPSPTRCLCSVACIIPAIHSVYMPLIFSYLRYSVDHNLHEFCLYVQYTFALLHVQVYYSSLLFLAFKFNKFFLLFTLCSLLLLLLILLLLFHCNCDRCSNIVCCLFV